jgi:guanine deaminase
MSVARVLRGRVLTPRAGASPRFLADARVVIDAGKFASVEAWDDARVEGDVLDLRPAVLLPGFVDAHLHFPQTRIVGSASGPLLDWLERTVFPEEARFRERAYAEAVAAEFTRRLVQAGTTTSAIFSSSSAEATDALFHALDRSGLRATAGLTLMDQNCPEALRERVDRAIPACHDLIERWHGHDGGRLRFAVTPRFALSCSRALMEAAAELADREGLIVQTHVSENPAEGTATLEVHPYADDYLGVYDAVGLLGPRTVLAHAVHLSPGEWDRVRERGARVAHCPDSNFFLGSGRMRVAAARARSVPLALGSDVGAGRSFDVRRAMAYAYDNALCLGDGIDPAELLHLATLGGAEALGLGDVTGSIEAGKEADFVVLAAPAWADTEAQLLGEVAFGDTARVERTFVRGRELVV